jgi:hypothetical protein
VGRTGKKGNGKDFKKIDKDALSAALNGVELSEDEQALVDIVTNTINSDDEHVVEYADSDKNISAEGAEVMGVACQASLMLKAQRRSLVVYQLAYL